MREGRKENIELPIGSKCYLKLDCVSKPFPLKVKVQPIVGTFEICISKTIERPDKHNCDYFFNVPNFEIHYSIGEEIRELNFSLNGTGMLKLGITVNFSHPIVEIKKPINSYARHLSRQTSPTNGAYEFFTENMTHEEEKELVNIVSKYYSFYVGL